MERYDIAIIGTGPAGLKLRSRQESVIRRLSYLEIKI